MRGVIIAALMVFAVACIAAPARSASPVLSRAAEPNVDREEWTPAPSGGALAVPQRSEPDRYGFGFICRWNAWVGLSGAPEGVAIDGEGRVLVADRYEIRKYTDTGILVDRWGRDEVPGEFEATAGIAVDDSGYVYVADAGSLSIMKFTGAGELVTQWSGCDHDRSTGVPCCLHGIAADDSGYVYVTDEERGLVLKFTHDGTYLTQWGGWGTGDGQLLRPAGIAADHQGHVYVADWENARIQKFTTVGEHLASWAVRGIGVAVGAGDEVYIVDDRDGQVIELDGDGVELMRWGSPGREDGQFGMAVAAAVGRGGDVFVADEDGAVHRFGVATRWLITAAAGPGGSIHPVGGTWVADGMDHIYEIVPDLGYQVSEVSVDGRSVGRPAQYTFTDVRADHAIDAFFAPASAWPSDPLLNLPVCTDSIMQRFPAIASDGAGGAVLVWGDYFCGFETQAFRTRAQRIDARGAPLWGTGVCVDSSGLEQWPCILLPDGAGGAIVLWSKAGADLNERHLYVQRIDAEGRRRWGDNGVAICPDARNQVGVDMIADGSGGVIVAWSDFNSGASDGIRVQHVNAMGLPTWGAWVVRPAAAEALGSPKMATDDSAGAIVVWEGPESGLDGSHVHAQRVDAGGQVRWAVGGVLVSSRTFQRQHQEASIVSDGGGGGIVVWSEYPLMTGIGSGVCDLYAQRLNASGAVVWNGQKGVALCTAAGDQYSPHPVSDGSGGAIVAWVDESSGRGIRVQRLSASGGLQWDAGGIPVSLYAVYQEFMDQEYAAIVPDGAGGAIVAWVDGRIDTARVHAQRFNPDGFRAWMLGGVMLCSAAGSRSDLTVAADGKGGAIAAWVDGRDWDAGIYAQSVDHSGALGSQAPAAVERDAPPECRLAPVRPNPLTNGSLVVRFTLSGSTAAKVELVDVAGRRLVKREMGALGPGAHSIALTDAWRLAPGLYFVRVVADGGVRTARVVVVH